MKYKLITLVMSVLLISVAVAGLSGVIDNKTIDNNNFTTAEKTKLESLNIDTWDYEDRTKGDVAYRKLISDNEFNLPEIKVDTTYESCSNLTTIDNVSMCFEIEILNYTEEQVNDLLDIKMIEVMKDIAGTQIKRDDANSTDVREGGVSIGR